LAAVKLQKNVAFIFIELSDSRNVSNYFCFDKSTYDDVNQKPARIVGSIRRVIMKQAKVSGAGQVTVKYNDNLLWFYKKTLQYHIYVPLCCHYAECHYAYYHYAEWLYMSAVFLSDIMLSVIMLSVIMLSFIILSVIMLSVVAPISTPVSTHL